MTQITYNWSISNLDRTTEKGIVFLCHWHIRAFASLLIENPFPENGGPAQITSEVSAVEFGVENLVAPGESYVPYEDLAESEVVNWVKNSMGPEKVQGYEKGLELQVLNKLKPKTAEGLPWA